MKMTSKCDVTKNAHQIQMTTRCHWMKPPMKIFCVHHWCRPHNVGDNVGKRARQKRLKPYSHHLFHDPSQFWISKILSGESILQIFKMWSPKNGQNTACLRQKCHNCFPLTQSKSAPDILSSLCPADVLPVSSSATVELSPNFSGYTLPPSAHGGLLLQDIRLLMFRQQMWVGHCPPLLFHQVPRLQSRLGQWLWTFLNWYTLLNLLENLYTPANALKSNSVEVYNVSDRLVDFKW